jgi:gliding motility-associated-like protein
MRPNFYAFLFVLCSNFFHLTGFSQVDLQKGLVAFYPFNSNANDASGNNHNGQLMNGISLTSDRFGNPNQAYKFDGIDDYIRIQDNGAFSTPQFSIVVWFLSESNALQNLIGKKDFNNGLPGNAGVQYQFFINYAPYPGIGSNIIGNNSFCNNIVSSSYLNTGNNICINKWYCGVVTFDGNRHKLYINGELKRDELAGFNGMLDCKSELRFGNWWKNDLIPFKGVMDDIRWYNRALNETEILQLYDGFPSSAPNLQVKHLSLSCSGGNVNLTSSDVTAGSDANLTLTYWKDAAATSILNNPASISESGTYYIKANSGTNCSVIKPIHILKSTEPLLITNDIVGCAQEPIDLTKATVTMGSESNLTYSYWKDAAANVPLSINDAKNIKEVGIYYIKATNQQGCSKLGSVKVTFSELPDLKIQNPDPICTPNAIDLNKTITTSTNNIQISFWYDMQANLPISTTQAASISQTGTYYIKADKKGCFIIEPVTIIINEQPSLIINKPSPICANATFDLTSPALTKGSDPNLQFNYYDINETIILHPNRVSPGKYYIKAFSSNGCFNQKPVEIASIQLPNSTLKAKANTVCKGELVVLKAAGGESYKWFNKSNSNLSSSDSLIYKPIESDSIYVEISSNSCSKKDTLSMFITVNPLPFVSILKSNDIDCNRPSATLTATGGLQFEWYPNKSISNSVLSNPTVYPESDTWYKVEAVDQNNCRNQDSVLVKASFSFEGGRFYIPNAFTPNGDGKNDCFHLKHWTAIKEVSISIYDRWGNRIFFTQDINACWNGINKGKQLPSGNYVYLIEAKSACSVKPLFLKGTIAIIR